MRSRRPRAAGSRSRSHGLTARSPSSIARSVDHLERLERVADRARIGTRREEFVGEALDIAPLNPRETRTAERGEDVKAERALILAHDRRLVPPAGPRADRSARESVDEGLCGLEERLRRACEPHTLRRLRLSSSAPTTCFAECPEGLRDLALADRVVSRDAVARLAVAASAFARGARSGVTDFDSLGHQLPRPTVARAAARSSQRSSSATATRIRRPRRTTRSS